MQKVTIYCDRCGREIEEPYKIIGHKIDKNTGDYLTDEGDKLDFCRWCFESIMSDITDNIRGGFEDILEESAELEAELDELPFCDPEDDLEDEEPKEDPEVKEKIERRLPMNFKQLDIGKMKSLRRAGWSLKNIADEMGCAPQTVANKLKKEGMR